MYNKYRKEQAAAKDRIFICILTIIIMCLIWAFTRLKEHHETTTTNTNDPNDISIPTQRVKEN